MFSPTYLQSVTVVYFLPSGRVWEYAPLAAISSARTCAACMSLSLVVRAVMAFSFRSAYAPALHAKAKQLDPSGGRILFAPVQALPMSSSQLRARLANGEECEAELLC